MAQQLGGLPALLEDMGPSPSTCKEAYNQTRLQFQEILCPFLWILSKHTEDMADIHTCRQNIHTRRKNLPHLREK